MLQQVFDREISFVCVHAPGRATTHVPTSVIYPGSFNPLHRGHLELAAIAEEHLGKPVAFELSIANVDKPDLPAELVSERLRQFTHRPVLVTRAPTFAEKARLFPNTTFVVGADTAIRIVQPRYYGGELAMRTALAGLRELGCRFLVGGRMDASGTFVEAHQVPVPVDLTDLFEGLPESRFRVDISSTELRHKMT